MAPRRLRESKLLERTNPVQLDVWDRRYFAAAESLAPFIQRVIHHVEIRGGRFLKDPHDVDADEITDIVLSNITCAPGSFERALITVYECDDAVTDTELIRRHAARPREGYENQWIKMYERPRLHTLHSLSQSLDSDVDQVDVVCELDREAIEASRLALHHPAQQPAQAAASPASPLTPLPHDDYLASSSNTAQGAEQVEHDGGMDELDIGDAAAESPSADLFSHIPHRFLTALEGQCSAVYLDPEINPVLHNLLTTHYGLTVDLLELTDVEVVAHGGRVAEPRRGEPTQVTEAWLEQCWREDVLLDM